MAAHVFGATSSPSCSYCALTNIAADNVKKYGKEVPSNMRRNFHVEDILKGFPSARITVDMIQKVKPLCKEGGCNLTKFSSNHREVLKSILEEI